MRRSMSMMMRVSRHYHDHTAAALHCTTQKKCLTMNVITIITPHPILSQQMIVQLQKWIQPWQGLNNSTDSITVDGDNNSIRQQIATPCQFTNDCDDALDEYVRFKTNHHRNSILQYLPNLPWSTTETKVDSMVVLLAGSSCVSNSKTLVHFVSSATKRTFISSFSKDRGSHNSCMDLLAIQSMQLPVDIIRNQNDLIQEVRNQLAQLLTKEDQNRSISKISLPSTSWIDNLKISILEFIWQQQRTYTKPNTSVFLSLLHKNQYLPYLDFNPPSPSCNNSDNDTVVWKIGDLKEIVIPFDCAAVSYNKKYNRPTLLKRLSDLYRPVTGLYQLPHNSSVCIRPIPMAKEDRTMSLSPTLIFHSDSQHMDDVQHNQTIDHNNSAAKFMKIGYTGRGASSGQLMITDGSWNGINVRLCSQSQRTSIFAEAQDSLLASSLSELQSQDVLRISTDNANSKVDPRINNTDCWVEFRANVRNPLGFIVSSSSLLSTTSSPKIAKAPDLPYE